MSPLAHGLGQSRLPGIPTELGPEDMDDSRRFGRGKDLACFVQRGGERFFAHDVPAGGDRFERELRMDPRRCGDGHGVDTGDGQRVARMKATARGTSKSLARSAVLSGSRPTSASTSKPDGAQGPHVGVTTEPRSDDGDPGHRHPGSLSAPSGCSTEPSRRRVASAALTAASRAPSAWSSSENTSTPIGASAPICRSALR